MPSRKKGKKSSGRYPSLLSHPAVVSILGVLLAVLFMGGQIQLLRGHTLQGFILSIVSIAAGLGFYFGRDFLPQVRFPSRGASGNRTKGSKAAKSRKGGSFLKGLKPIAVLQAFGMVLSFVLGGIGQFYLCQAGNESTLHTGSWFYLAAVVLLVAAFWPWMRERLKNAAFSFQWEMILLGLILVLAAFLRSYQIASIPSGLFIDQGFQGYSALRILHENWRPFYVEDIFHAYSLALYQLAFWFKLFGASEVSLKLFYAFLGLLGLPLVYWSFRQLAGPRVALLALFILAVMRWNILFSRNGFPTVQMTLYMFGTLAFLLCAIHRPKPSNPKFFYGAAIVAGVFFAVGVFPFAFLSLYWTLKTKSVVLAILAVLAALALLALMGYCIKVSKKRESLVAMLIAAAFFAAGTYTYQAFKAFPLLLLAWALYEAVVNWKTLQRNRYQILLFAVLAVVLTLPVLFNPNTRENDLSIFPHIRAEHSLRPFWNVFSRTALMFNRLGDPNPRHNLQDYRMLDDVSGVLMVLGLVYALFRVWRRKYFYAVAGFFIMSLTCILSIDAAHANRLFAMTPFIAFLIATPLAAFWGRLRALWAERGDWAFLFLAAPFLMAMAFQNFDVYFHKEARSPACWSEYSIAETAAGRMVAQNGGAYDYYITPRYYNFFTVDFLAYPWLNQVKPLLLPDDLISRHPDNGRGLYYAIEQGRTGILDMLKTLYPEGKDEYLVDPTGNTTEYFFRVPPEVVAKSKGLTAHFDREVGGVQEKQINQFPAELPAGPYHAILTGNLYVPLTGDYRWELKGNVEGAMWVKGKRNPVKAYVRLEKGEHPIKVELEVPAGAVPGLTIQQTTKNGIPTFIDAGSFDSLPIPHGLMGQYFNSPDGKGEPFLVQWDPALNFTNGNDFSTPPTGSIRWSGTLDVDQAGSYRFIFSSGNAAETKIDGKVLAQNIFLKKGLHSIEILLGRSRVNWNTFTLSWVRPDAKMEVVPYSAFGKIP